MGILKGINGGNGMTKGNAGYIKNLAFGGWGDTQRDEWE